MSDPTEWRNAKMICAVCSHEWVGTYPAEATVLECGCCGHMNPAPGIEHDDE